MPPQTETQADMIARLLTERDTLAAKLARLQEAAENAQRELITLRENREDIADPYWTDTGQGRIAIDQLRSALAASRE